MLNWQLLQRNFDCMRMNLWTCWMGECLLFLDSRLESDLFMLERLGFEITCQSIARQLLTIILTIHNCQQELLSVSYNNKSTYKCSCYLHIFAIHKKTKRNSLSFACTTMQTVIWNLKHTSRCVRTSGPKT